MNNRVVSQGRNESRSVQLNSVEESSYNGYHGKSVTNREVVKLVHENISMIPVYLYICMILYIYSLKLYLCS